ALVVDGVAGIDPEAVDVEVAQPSLGALQGPLAHRPAALVVVVDRVAPERLVLAAEPRSERAEVVAARGTDVVVDDVEDDAEADAMGGVDQALEAVRTPVRVVRRGD